jgi:hypothetical protein
VERGRRATEEAKRKVDGGCSEEMKGGGGSVRGRGNIGRKNIT